MLLSDEFRVSNFGDKRLTQRVMNLADTISENPECSINAACGSFAASKAAYRFLQNEKVNPRAILKNHSDNTLSRANACEERVLIIQDTTDLIYTQFPSVKGLGQRLHAKDGYKGGVNGLLLHSSLAVRADGVPLGLLKQTFFTYDEIRENREQDEVNVPGLNKKTPIEKKASFRWIDHLMETSKALGSIASHIVHVADRECDIYEFLQAAHDQSSNFVVRSSWNRRTHEGPSFHEASNIEEKLKEATILGKITLNIDGKPVNCFIKIIDTVLKPPQRSREAKSMVLNPLPIGVVEVKQIDYVSDPIHWRLLTNLPIHSIDEAVEVLSIYKQRWSIECFHRILKSGFGVEESRLANRKRLENLASLLSIVSWHIFWLFQFGRKMPELAAAKVFDPLTIEVLKTSAKKLKIAIGPKLSIGKAVFIIARLGGFLGRKGDGEPGMKSIWRGWRSLHERIIFMEALTCG